MKKLVAPKTSNLLRWIFIFPKYFLRLRMFFPFRIFYFGERNLIKIFKTYVDDKIYPCEIPLSSS